MKVDIDLGRFKVVYSDKVYHALALREVSFRDLDSKEMEKNIINKPVFLGILAINEDGNVIDIYDEAWMFQFVPIVQK
ncbi:hypothetical protein [Lacrimispora sp.]|uniref:hypothetical protein n=1 Tax=Lacrimispora sp. TaxID=2719234 RepID=UPI00289B68E8|nr:hypothetical protein [Lacrimispora sp.]